MKRILMALCVFAAISSCTKEGDSSASVDPDGRKRVSSTQANQNTQSGITTTAAQRDNGILIDGGGKH